MGRSGRYIFGKLFDLISFLIGICPVSQSIRDRLHLVQHRGEKLFTTALQAAAEQGPVVAQLFSTLVAQSAHHVGMIRSDPAFQV